MTVAIIIIVILAIVYFLAIMPRITPRPMYEFKGWYYAHRGFHDNQSDAPENSLKAMRLAVENGYTIDQSKQLVIRHSSQSYYRAHKIFIFRGCISSVGKS